MGVRRSVERQMQDFYSSFLYTDRITNHLLTLHSNLPLDKKKLSSDPMEDSLKDSLASFKFSKKPTLSRLRNKNYQKSSHD